MKVGIVGAGLQGRRRARALRAVDSSELVAVADVDEDAIAALAAEASCLAISRWKDVVERDDVQAVIICTPPHLHAEIAVSAMRRGKHVLCEKPLARTMDEGREMVKVAREAGVTLKCGFNLRYHPAIRQVRQWYEDGSVGEIDWIRCRYGIGGRSGYDQEWRAKAEISGGGQLMDQGIHLLDLCRWFLGDFAEASGMVATYFWDVAPVEDNAFALLRTAQGQIASVHVSWTQWKPLFSFEVFGHDGYLVVEGLGGAYGNERAIRGRRDFAAPFGEEVIEFRREDRSWEEEWREFVSAIREGREPSANGEDGLAAIELVHAIYESARLGKAVATASETPNGLVLSGPG
jgi:predicted dehydrogenase